MYAQKYGGDVIQMSPSEEADFLMKCNEMEVMPCISEAKVWSSADYGKIKPDRNFFEMAKKTFCQIIQMKKGKISSLLEILMIPI